MIMLFNSLQFQPFPRRVRYNDREYIFSRVFNDRGYIELVDVVTGTIVNVPQHCVNDIIPITFLSAPRLLDETTGDLKPFAERPKDFLLAVRERRRLLQQKSKGRKKVVKEVNLATRITGATPTKSLSRRKADAMSASPLSPSSSRRKRSTEQQENAVMLRLLERRQQQQQGC